METLFIEQVAFGGKGVGHLSNGKVCFVPGVLPNERAVVQIRRERSKYAEADLEKVLEASPDRITPGCPYYGPCGGCQYQHVKYQRQLLLKSEQVADVLRRIGGILEPLVEATVPSPLEFGYRNRITVHARNGRIGFYGARSHSLVDITECAISSAGVNAQLADLRKARPRDGEYPLRESGEFRGFRQVNDAAAPLLVRSVSSMTEGGGTLLVDAYCGAGFFSRQLRDRFSAVIGIEWSADAVRSARENASGHESYLLGDVTHHLPEALAGAPAAESTLLLDPPAEGLAGSVVDIISSRTPQRVIYVSCNPSTLARDIKRLAANYTLRRVVPVDMFPQTAEIEAVALLERS